MDLYISKFSFFFVRSRVRAKFVKIKKRKSIGKIPLSDVLEVSFWRRSGWPTNWRLPCWGDSRCSDRLLRQKVKKFLMETFINDVVMYRGRTELRHRKGNFSTLRYRHPYFKSTEKWINTECESVWIVSEPWKEVPGVDTCTDTAIRITDTEVDSDGTY